MEMRRTATPPLSTTRGLQLANSEGIPIYTINSDNAASLLPNMNVTSGVLQNIEDEIDTGDTVTIPADTLIMNQWAGSVWIDQNANGTGYLIEGGLFGGSTTEDSTNTKGTNPTCSDLNSGFDTAAGNYDSDYLRAVAYQENAWTQFNTNGTPSTHTNWNGSTDVGLMQVNTTSNTDATTLNNLEYNWQDNLQAGTNVFNWAYGEATKYFNSLKLNIPPNADQVLEETYFTYNHGHATTDQYFNDVNGQLTLRQYPPGSQAAQAEKNATSTDEWYKTQPWNDPNGGPKGPLGCSGPVQ